MFDFLAAVWRKNLSGKLTLIAGALILVGAAVGVTYAVAVRPGDLTFLERDGRELRWDRRDVPVDCFYLPSLPEPYTTAYGAARRTLARVVGGDLLAPCVPWRLESAPSRAPDGSVLLRPRNGGDSHGAETRHRFDRRTGRIVSAVVAFDLDLPVELLERVALHEAGHVLGLDHDRGESSVMFPSARGRAKELTDRDVEALRRAYLR
jgi:hypothetical protein